MTYVPDLPILLQYSVAVVALFVIPGPDMSLCLSKTLVAGRRAAFFAMSGIFFGCFVHTMLVALGVAILLKTSSIAFLTLKIAGAIYLLWLAIQAIRHGSALNINLTNAAKPSDLQNFLTGIGINLTNPKIVLFFLTFLPQFVRSDDPYATGKLMFLGTAFIVISVPLMALLITFADKVVGRVKRNPFMMRALDYMFATIFGVFAIGVLTTSEK